MLFFSFLPDLPDNFPQILIYALGLSIFPRFIWKNITIFWKKLDPSEIKLYFFYLGKQKTSQVMENRKNYP